MQQKKRIFHAPLWRNTVLFLLGFGFLGVGAFAIWASTLSLPSFEAFHERQVSESTKIYDRTGEVLLYDIHQNIRRTVVPLEEMAPAIKNATIAIEDGEFYEHSGIKPTAIIRATFVNLSTLSFSQGGSTITQQVVKNTLLSQEKTIARKLKEMVLAIKLEQQVSKDRILSLYLNEAPYGSNIYGVEEASKAFYGKSAADLTIAEAAYLAALPKAPTYYSPYGQHRDALEARKNKVLSRMRTLGFISQEEYENARTADVTFARPDSQGIKAPHFVMWIKEHLEEEYGSEVLRTGGYKVTTTLDYDLQKEAQDIVSSYAEENAKKFNATNAGMVGMDPRSGEVLVMVGSRDYFSTSTQGNFNITLAERQPGSAFKPIVYASALSEGYTPKTTVFDTQTQFHSGCTPTGEPKNAGVSPDACYQPVNYDHRFRGPVTFREALAQSINIPALKALYLTGVEDALELAHELGITSLGTADQYGLTLVLGGGEVSLLEMTNAYSVFANKGIRNPEFAIKRVEDRSGEVIEENEPQGERVLEENVALQISDILSDNAARAPAFGQNSPLHFPNYDVAAKTGTTNNYRDAWVIGYTPTFALGTWAGNNDNTSMSKRVAGFVVAPMWHAFMEEALPERPRAQFTEPQKPPYDELKPILRGKWRGGRTYTIDTVSGDRATEHTPEETREERVVPNVHSILHWVDKDTPRGPRPANPQNDPQYTLWEHSVQKWAEERGIENKPANEVIPEGTDEVHTPDNAPEVSITSPDEGVSVARDERVEVDLDITPHDDREISRVKFSLDGHLLGTARDEPFALSFIPEEFDISAGEYTLRVVAYDSVSSKTVTTRTITVREEE